MSSDFFAHETAVLDKGCSIGKGTKIWHFCHVMPTCIVGERCNIGQNVFLDSNVIIGNGVKIQNNVSVYNSVIIEDDCFLGPSMVFTNVVNPRAHIERKHEYKKTVIGRGSSVGANATIVCGNRIGQYAFIGAGAVVTKEVPDYSLVVGNPARQIGWVGEYGHRLEFNKENIAICVESQQEYRLVNNQVFRIK
jgi:UDP-2-acetamido-3-amino-2,3-dideoxy-glucuronate N-acetyltransferase